MAGADIGLTRISFAVGLALIAMAYGIGPVSGCHINPAVSLGMVAAAVLWVIATGKAGYTLAENGLGQNGWGAGYLGEY